MRSYKVKIGYFLAAAAILALCVVSFGLQNQSKNKDALYIEHDKSWFSDYFTESEYVFYKCVIKL